VNKRENGFLAPAFRIATVLVVAQPRFLRMSELKPLGKRKNVYLSDHGASQSFWWKRDLDLLQVRVFGPILFEVLVDAFEPTPFFFATFSRNRGRQSPCRGIGL
jgi:hypothetical protein